MSGKERGLFRMIFNSFIQSFKLNQHKLIGEDYCGTKYYEIISSSRRKPSRYFIPINKEDFEQELPPEWEAWLRHRRKEPPSVEEIETNYQLQIKKKQNAAQIEATYSIKKLEDSVLPAQKQGYESFPVYEEYKNASNYKVKFEKKK